MVGRDTANRILDAAFERVNAVGMSRTTVEDVARAAGITRQTVYRYYASKDQLLTMLLVREEERLLSGVRARLDANQRFEDGLADALLYCLTFARQHPLLDRLLATDSETLLPYLTTRAGPLIVRARSSVIDLLKARSVFSPEVLDACADAIVRIVLSYAVTPPEDPPEVVARDLARILAGPAAAEEGPDS
jgi:AcrR family transcriptional regulator